MSRSATEKSRILVLDDDPGILLLQRKALERAGYEVIAVSSARKAWEEVNRQLPDLLVLDYQLGATETGLDFYRELRNKHGDRPAILVTGFSDEGRAIEALRAGIRDVVPKVGEYLNYLPEAVQRVLEQVSAAARLLETETANRAKDHFLAVLSHELRNPLTPVLAAVRILLEASNLPEDLVDPVRTIHRNVELEARLIDDLLDLTRVTRGKLELHLSPTDVHEKISDALKTIEAEVTAKKLQTNVDLQATQHIVQADAARLLQILWNVLKNAVKFTPDGGRITVHTFDSQSGRIRIEVQDTGIGIEPAILPGIFDPFEQGSRDVTRTFGGLGLGLSITRNLVEMHNGWITAHSDGTNRGAKITIELPGQAAAKRDGNGMRKGTDLSATHSIGQSVRVLLVEDHQDTCRLMARLLRGSGYHVATADSVSSALETAGTDRFDVLVSDIGLPDGSGFDLMRQLLARQPIKGVALSGFGMEEDVRRSKEAGFAEHLIKPVDPLRLERVIQSLTGREKQSA
jgi:signal transduction histidine kinase